MNLPHHLIQEISKYDYSLMFTLFDAGIPILPSQCTYKLIKFAVQNHHCKAMNFGFSHVNLSHSEVEELFETAVMYGNVNAVRYLYSTYYYSVFNTCSYKSHYISEYIMYAIQEKYFEVVQFLLIDRTIELDYQMILEAVENGNIQLVQDLLNNPQLDDPSYEGENEALIRAIELGNYDLVNVFCKCPNIDIHEPDNEPIKVAIDYGETKIVRLLFQDRWVKATLQLDSEQIHTLKRILVM